MDKSWPFDHHVDCLKHPNLAFICEEKSNLIEELNVEFMNELVKCKEFSNVYDTSNRIIHLELL